MCIFICFFLPVCAQASNELFSGLVELQEDVYVGSAESFETAASTTVRLNGYEIVIEGDMQIGPGTRFVGNRHETITFASPEAVLIGVAFEGVRTVITSASSSISNSSFSEYETALTLYVGTHVIRNARFEGGETAIVYKRRFAHQVRTVAEKVFAYMGLPTAQAAEVLSALDVRIVDSRFERHSDCVIANNTQYVVYVSGASWKDGVPTDGHSPPCTHGNVIIDNEPSSCPSVIFIPGMQGTRLYWRNQDGEMRQVWEPSIASDADYLTLDEEGRSFHGIETGRPIDELRFLADLYTDPVYAGIMQRLATHQQQCGGGFGDFGYDWRLPVDHAETLRELDELVQRMRGEYPEKKIVFVAHSMGGLIAKQYIADHAYAAEVIDGVMFIGTPHVGTPKAYASVLHGDGFDIAGGLILSEAAARRIAAFSEAALALFPSMRFFSVASTTIEYEGEKLTNHTTIGRFLSASREDNRQGLDTSIPMSIGSELLGQGDMLHGSLDDMVFPVAVRTASLIGTGLPTLWGLQYRQKIEQRCGSFGASCIAVESLEHLPLFRSRGDGTVMTASARYAPGQHYLINLWNQKGGEGQKISHYNMTELAAVQECVFDFLDGRACGLPDTDTSQIFMTLGIHSPLVALDPTDVEMFGDAHYISFPMDGEEYESVWQGSGYGSAELSVSIDGDRYTMVPQPLFVATSTVVRVHMKGVVSEPIQMTISYDYDGDGVFEFIHHYLVSGDGIWRDYSSSGSDRLGMCAWLPSWHRSACFFEQLFAGRDMPLIERTLYDRNVLTGQRQEAVTGRVSGP